MCRHSIYTSEDVRINLVFSGVATQNSIEYATSLDIATDNESQLGELEASLASGLETVKVGVLGDEWLNLRDRDTAKDFVKFLELPLV